jgi:hypothetical protein
MNGDCDELSSLSGPESNKPLLQINITPSQITEVPDLNASSILAARSPGGLIFL